jgi:hypothetical protein
MSSAVAVPFLALKECIEALQERLKPLLVCWLFPLHAVQPGAVELDLGLTGLRESIDKPLGGLLIVAYLLHSGFEFVHPGFEFNRKPGQVRLEFGTVF